MLTTTGTRASARRDTAVEPGFGLCVWTMSGRSSRNSPYSSAERAQRPRAGAMRRVAWRSGTCRRPVGRARRRTGRAPTHRRPRSRPSASRSSCGPSSSSRLMSVVVTCTTSGRARRSRGGRRVPAPVEHPAQRRPRSAMPPAALRTNQRCPSLVCTGERASRYGSVRAVRVGPGAGDRRRAEPGPHRPLGGRRSEHRLRVGEVERRGARGARRSARSTGRARRRPRRGRAGRAGDGVCVCEPTSTSPVAHGVAERGPRARAARRRESGRPRRRTRSRRRA